MRYLRGWFLSEVLSALEATARSTKATPRQRKLARSGARRMRDRIRVRG